MQKLIRCKYHNNQSGFGIIGALLSLMITSIIIVMFINFENKQRIKTNSEILGNKIAMVVNAIKHRLIADVPLKEGTYNIKLLINTSCGGTANSDYLPCAFSLKSDLYIGDITITVPKSKDHDKILTASIKTTTIGRRNPKTDSIDPVPHLAGQSLLSAQAYVVGQNSAIVSYKLDKIKSIITADIVAEKSSAGLPIGVVMEYPSLIAPNGFLECNGQFYSKREYPQLYEALGSDTLPEIPAKEYTMQGKSIKFTYVIKHD